MSSNIRSLSAIMAAAMMAPLAAAAPEYCPVEVRTATVTACFPNVGRPVKPTCDVACPTPVAKHNKEGPIQVYVQAPKCDSCGCDSCAHTNVYTTTYDAFCPTGISKQEYVVTEVYAGMSAKPSVTAAPKIPFGFAVDVKTCNECGKKPITATLTYPADGCPYINDVSEPAGAPEGSPAYAVCIDTPVGPGKSWPGTGPGGLPAPGPGANGGGPGAAPGGGPGGAPGAGPGAGPGGAPGAAPGAGPGGAPGAAPGAAPGGAPGAGPGGAPGAAPGAAPGGGSSPAGAAPGAAGGAPAGPGGAAPGGNAAAPPADGAGSAPAQPTGSSGHVQVSGSHPAFVAITVGGVLGFLLSFVAAL